MTNPRHDYPPVDYVERALLHRPSYEDVMRRVREQDERDNARHIRIEAEPSLDEGIYIIAGMLAGAFVAGVLLWILLP